MKVQTGFWPCKRTGYVNMTIGGRGGGYGGGGDRLIQRPMQGRDRSSSATVSISNYSSENRVLRASALSLWRDRFLQAGQASVKCKTGELDERDEQISKLKMAKEKSQDGIDLSEKKTIMKRLRQ